MERLFRRFMENYLFQGKLVDVDEEATVRRAAEELLGSADE